MTLSMRPLLRYTIGPASEAGFELLAASVVSFRKLYPWFDIIIAHNNLTKAQETFVTALGTQLYRQTGDELPIPPKDVAWKLYPPRLRQAGYEIVMDNDLLIVNRLKEIEVFLKGDQTMITADRVKLLGRFDEVVNDAYNSGFFGMPPGYDFKSLILKTFQEANMIAWEHRFDEQGLVAKIISCPPCIVVPLESINIIEARNKEEWRNANGLHFIGTNRGEDEVWRMYKRLRTILHL